MGNMPSNEKLSPPEKYIEFMNGGGCKESFKALIDCKTKEKKEGSTGSGNCGKFSSELTKCMKAHSDYYQPLIHVDKETIIQGMAKDFEAKIREKLGNSDQGDGKSQEELYNEFMKGGSCKEAFMAHADCAGGSEPNQCGELFSKLAQCMDTHSDYYPSLSLQNKTTLGVVEQIVEDKLRQNYKDLFGLELPA